jgi:Arc-like DNA binding domain
MAARKTTDLVQVKLRIPEWLRRQVLAEAKKSGRSLNGELAHLIEEGLIKPRYESLITKAAEVASVEAAALMAGAITGALKEALKETPEGLATLKAVAASVPGPRNDTSGRVVSVTMPSGREPYRPFSYSEEPFTHKEYSRFAARCLEIAQASPDAQNKAVMLKMAQTWSRLADETEAARSTQSSE